MMRSALPALLIAGTVAACGPGDDGHPPSPTDDTAQTDEDTAVTIDVLANDVDPDGDPLSLSAVRGSGATIEGGRIRLTPARDFHGAVELTYTVTDGELTADGRVTVTVRPLNDGPSAHNAAVIVGRNTSKAFALSGFDADGDALTYELVTQPGHGTVTGDPPNLTYTPAQSYAGNDSLSFRVRDGAETSAPASINFTVAAGTAPVAEARPITTAEDTGVAATLAGTDADGDPLTFRITAQPAHGTLSGTAPALTYTPAANFHGTDSFRFTAYDGTLTSAAATVTITVTPVNDPPRAIAMPFAAIEDTAVAMTLTVVDVDGDPLTYTITAPPGHGELTGANASRNYAPAANYHGPDQLTFTVSDAQFTSEPATVSITVAPVNDPPTGRTDEMLVTEDRETHFSLDGRDVDGDPLTYTIVSEPTRGTLTGTGAARVYTPRPDVHGPDSLTFRVADPTTHTTLTIPITILPVNDRPVATDDIVIVAPDEPSRIDVLLNDRDADGDELRIASVEPARHGTIEIADGQLAYTPANGSTETETIRYTVADPAGGTATGTVRIGVGQFPAGLPLQHIGRALPATVSSPGISIDLSADGRYVAFASPAALVADDQNNVADVYVYDRLDGVMERVSVGPGAESNGTSSHPTISANGRYVAFSSLASNLVAGDTNGDTDVFVHDRVTGRTLRASVGPGGVEGTEPSFAPDLSDDGAVVAFTSLASELVAGDGNGVHDVFVRDLTAERTTRVSVATGGGEADGASTQPALSGDGRTVAFVSSATNLIAGDGNSVVDVFVHDLGTSETTRVSVSATGGDASAASRRPALSRDGRYVAFVSTATAGTSSGAFVRDRQRSITTEGYCNGPLPGTVCQRDVHHVQLSADGRYLMGHAGDGTLFIRDFVGAATHVSDTGIMWPMISANGRYVAFLAGAPPGSTGTHVYVQPNQL